MAAFGIDPAIIKKFNNEFDIENVRRDQISDFFFLPQFDAIYHYCADSLKKSISLKLKNSSYAPYPPINMEIPKHTRVSPGSTSSVTPNYFRPGSVLHPEDRIIYHFLAQEAELVIENAIDRNVVFSNKPLSVPGTGFVTPSKQWNKLTSELEKTANSGIYTLVLKLDISQYYSAINQHELINQLEHQGLQPEFVKFTEKFLAGLTTDRSSRGLLQGLYASDILGNGYLTSIDEFIKDSKLRHFRYVDDIYVFFNSTESLNSFFPNLVKRLRDYDLSINESKTYVTAPIKLIKQETELDKAILIAKKEAIEKLTNYGIMDVDAGPYGGLTEELIEFPPDDSLVELESTISVFNKLENFHGEERHRAESFCLNVFRQAGDPIAVEYVVERWAKYPDRAREFSVYLNRFSKDPSFQDTLNKMLEDSAESMIEYQWAWACVIMRRLSKISEKLLDFNLSVFNSNSSSTIIKSLVVYTICAHGSAQKKKLIRDMYASSPLLVQLAIIHCCSHFTAGERNALLKTAESHGETHKLMCEAFKARQKDVSKSNG